MQHLEAVDLDIDDRVFALLDDGSNRASHTSMRAWMAQCGFNAVNKELGDMMTTNAIPKYKGIGFAKGRWQAEWSILRCTPGRCACEGIMDV